MTNIAREALEHLNGGENWIKGNLRRDDKFCSIGAVYQCESVGDIYRILDTVGVLSAVAAEQYPERLRENMKNIAAVNDHEDTTWADIERIFEKAAVQIDEQA